MLANPSTPRRAGNPGTLTMTRNTLHSLARWLRSVVLAGLRERTEKQAAGTWDYIQDSAALTVSHGTLKHVARLLWKKSRTS